MRLSRTSGVADKVFEGARPGMDIGGFLKLKRVQRIIALAAAVARTEAQNGFLWLERRAQARSIIPTQPHPPAIFTTRVPGINDEL